MNVEDLAEHVGHKAGDGDARHEQVKTAQRRESLPLSLIGDGGDHVRDEQRRHHHRQDNPPRQRRAENAHGQIGRQEDKREGKGAPGGMEAENGDRQLHQVVAGGNDGDMKQRKPDQRREALLCGKRIHVVAF